MNKKLTAGEHFPPLSWMAVQGAKLSTAQELLKGLQFVMSKNYPIRGRF